MYSSETHKTIIRAVVGSQAHGLSTGSDDRDEMGVCIDKPNEKRIEEWMIDTYHNHWHNL